MEILILVIFGSLSLGFGITVDGTDGWTDGASIFIGVVFSILIVAISEFWHNKILKESQQNSNNVEIVVVRCKRLRQIPIFEIVVGDVVCLMSGDQVPSHGLLFDGPNSLQLELNEAKYDPEVGDEGIELNNLTGHVPLVFSGTEVVDGLLVCLSLQLAWMQNGPKGRAKLIVVLEKRHLYS